MITISLLTSENEDHSYLIRRKNSFTVRSAYATTDASTARPAQPAFMLASVAVGSQKTRPPIHHLATSNLNALQPAQGVPIPKIDPKKAPQQSQMPTGNTLQKKENPRTKRDLSGPKETKRDLKTTLTLFECFSRAGYTFRYQTDESHRLPQDDFPDNAGSSKRRDKQLFHSL